MTGFAKVPPTPEEQGISLAMVLLAEPVLPAREQLVAQASARSRAIVIDEVRPEMITLTVDGSRIVVGLVAALVADDGRTFDVARADLPKGCREGTVLRADGEDPDWSNAEIDEAEGRRRLEHARETLRRLSETDPGGDVEL
jgi:hypothetical protein